MFLVLSGAVNDSKSGRQMRLHRSPVLRNSDLELPDVGLGALTETCHVLGSAIQVCMPPHAGMAETWPASGSTTTPLVCGLDLG